MLEIDSVFWIGLERYWYWDIGYWAILAVLGRIDIGPIFFVGRTPNTILSVLVCRPDDKHNLKYVTFNVRTCHC